MAKRRIYGGVKAKLINAAKEIIDPKAEREALDAAYSVAEVLVRAAIEDRFPPRDMSVLAKYSCVTQEEDPKLQLPTSAVKEFKFQDDTAPLIPNVYDYKRIIYLGGEDCETAIDQWRDALQAYEAEKNKRLEAYRTLVLGSTYLEDIIQVWPEAASLVPNDPFLPAIMREEEVKIINLDRSERVA